MTQEQERLIETVLSMDDSTYYTIDSGAGLLDGFTMPLMGETWKLLLFNEIKAYIYEKEYTLNE
jgi:hypothetical protein